MILNALCDYYDALVKTGRVPRDGFSEVRISFALNLDEQGRLCGVIPTKVGSPDGKKELPQPMLVPEQQGRTSGTSPNFLCDNSSYFFGTDGKGNPARSLECFEKSAELHQKLLADLDCPAARAVCAFFGAWRPEESEENPVLQPYIEEIKKGANLVFTLCGRFVHEDAEIIAAWQRYRGERSADAARGRCLVTGKLAPIARLHPSIKGIKDAQSSGATLVAFNASAFESYGHEGKETGQGLNSPVSEEAAFKYGAALNNLTSDRVHTQFISDTTVVYWAEDAEPLYSDVFSFAMYGNAPEMVADSDLRGAFKSLAEGYPIDINGVSLHPENRFFVLGIAPNASRLCIRFFHENSLGKMLSNVQAHYKRLAITDGVKVDGSIPLWRMLNATVNPNSKDKKAAPFMTRSVIGAILNDSAYPVSLFEQTLLRIRAERKITHDRAAIIKAFLLKNKNFEVPKEVLTVELNEQTNYMPYVMGRLFAVLERVQQAANPGINATIKDKYFNSACSTPATIFPLLTKLSQSHLRKLDDRRRIYFEKLIGDLETRITETLPASLSLADQGTFHLGYYHQVQKFYEKKDKGENENG